ncbi:hypothetical protein RDI58_000733 [Solanum bulbocastanum]|uniref:Uncharacterized protein n=1 Tax=Solanum bulbocastanum TaxID=147425 RepID=A0AAN8YPE3_SOLBU
MALGDNSRPPAT